MKYKMVSELKNRFEQRLNEVRPLFRVTDPVYKFIKEDHIGDFRFNTGLRMLPIELVEKYGAIVLQDETQYRKYSDLKYDVYMIEWEKHLEGYWMDKLCLLEEYLQPVDSDKTPIDIYNHLNDLMIKIERRSMLLIPDPKVVEQKHTRLSGAEKDYIFLRNYWVDDDGVKKRMISKHVGEKYNNIEREVMDIFHLKGYGVFRDYKSGNFKIYDLVIDRGDMKTVIEIKILKEDKENKIFNRLFMFVELLKKFQEQYPNG